MTPADAGFAALARTLHRKAGQLAKAHGELRRRRLRQDGSGWRKASLLWPLFSERID